MSPHILISTQGSGLSQSVDERIIRKIDQLVNVRVKDTLEMRRHLDVFVKNEIMSEDEIQPLPSNRRFYPKLSDIRSHMYRATMKHRFSKVDQENVAEKVLHWKASSPEDFFYFRPYGEALQDIQMWKVLTKRTSKPFYSSIKLHGSVDSCRDMGMTCVYWMPHTKQPATL